MKIDERLKALIDSKDLLYENFLTVYNIQTFLGGHNLAALKVINGFYISAFRFHLFNRSLVGRLDWEEWSIVAEFIFSVACPVE